MEYVIFTSDGRFTEPTMRSARWRAKQLLKIGGMARVDIWRVQQTADGEVMDLVAREVRLGSAHKEPVAP